MQDVRKEFTMQAASNLARQLDAECKSALDARLPEGWTMDDVARRVSIQVYPDEPSWEYYCLDGEPMFKIGPITSGDTRTERNSYILFFSRPVVRFTRPPQDTPSRAI